MTTAELQEQLTTLAAQKADARQIIERCEGAEQVCRHFLGKMLRAEDEAKAPESPPPVTIDILPFPGSDPAAG